MMIWLVVELPTPSQKWCSESQLGWWHSQLFLESHKIPWFQSPPTSCDSPRNQWKTATGLFYPVLYSRRNTSLRDKTPTSKNQWLDWTLPRLFMALHSHWRARLCSRELWELGQGISWSQLRAGKKWMLIGYSSFHGNSQWTFDQKPRSKVEIQRKEIFNI